MVGAHRDGSVAVAPAMSGKSPRPRLTELLPAVSFDTRTSDGIADNVSHGRGRSWITPVSACSVRASESRAAPTVTPTPTGLCAATGAAPSSKRAIVVSWRNTV